MSGGIATKAYLERIQQRKTCFQVLRRVPRNLLQVRLNSMTRIESHTFVEVSSHPLIVTTDEGIVFVQRRSMNLHCFVKFSQMVIGFVLTGKKLRKPLSPPAPLNLRRVIVLSWSYEYLALSSAGLARYADGERLMFPWRICSST